MQPLKRLCQPALTMQVGTERRKRSPDRIPRVQINEVPCHLRRYRAGRPERALLCAKMQRQVSTFWSVQTAQEPARARGERENVLRTVYRESRSMKYPVIWAGIELGGLKGPCCARKCRTSGPIADHPKGARACERARRAPKRSSA